MNDCPNSPQGASAWLLLAWLLATAWLTLRPEPAAAWAAAQSPWSCVACGQAGGADLFLNVALFTPLGWLLARRGGRLRSALLLGFGLSLAIEITQGALIPGRDAALGDLLANGTGTGLGWWLASCTASGRWPRIRRWLPGVALLAFAAALTASGVLLGPDWQGPAPLRLVEPPAFEGRPLYAGGVGGLRVHAADSTGQVLAEVALEWVAPDTGVLTPILRLEDANGWPLLAVDRRGNRLAIEARTLATRLRLRTPTWSVMVPPGTRTSDPLLLALHLGHGAARLDLIGPSAMTGLVEPLGAQHGWLLLNPFAPTSGRTPWLAWTVAWLAAWGLVLGVATRMQRRRLAWGLAAVVVLLVVARLFQAPTTAIELLGFVAGWLAGVSSARFRRPPAGA